MGNIILGLLKPKEGKFKVDGIDINESNVENWQNSISFVPQNIFLIEGNLKDNIVFGEEPDLFSEEKFRNAIKMADLDEFITQSINGIETTVGEKGIALSGGQSQRVV